MNSGMIATPDAHAVTTIVSSVRFLLYRFYRLPPLHVESPRFIIFYIFHFDFFADFGAPVTILAYHRSFEVAGTTPCFDICRTLRRIILIKMLLYFTAIATDAAICLPRYRRVS